LKNVIKRASLLAQGPLIDVTTLPLSISNFSNPSLLPDTAASTMPVLDLLQEKVQDTLKGAGIDAEYELILSVLKKVKFNKTMTAKILNIDRKTLYNKLDQYKLLNEK
jgi:two-component system response regulator HydG